MGEEGRGGGEGWLHALLAVVVMDGDDNLIDDCLSKKRGWTREKERTYFVIVCWLIFFNAGQSISAVVAVCCCYHYGEKSLVNSITFFYIL